jgi:carboxylate-amine ligase
MLRPGPNRTDRLPQWAVWNAYGTDAYTIGAEDEVMLVDPADWSLVRTGREVMPSLVDELGASVQPETHAAVVELATGVHHEVGRLAAEMHALRVRLQGELAKLGLEAAAAGAHPWAERAEIECSDTPRYRLIEDTMRALARREPTMALHVHVGVPDPDDAVVLLNAFRPVIALLVALSANSPFSQGRDSGFASTRRALFGAFPRTGTPRAFDNYTDYAAALDGLIVPGAIPDASFIWWDVRLQPRFGTVELRAMDAQSTVGETAALVALVQSFARLVLEGDHCPPELTAEQIDENNFLAARDGVDGSVIDPVTGVMAPVRELVGRLVEDCRPHAAALGCEPELEKIAGLNSAARQRAGGDLPAVVAELAARFVR